MRQRSGVRGHISSKPSTCTERCDVDSHADGAGDLASYPIRGSRAVQCSRRRSIMTILAANWRLSGVLMAGVAASARESFRFAEKLLGGRGVLRTRPHSALDWIAVVRSGIPAAALEPLLKAMQLSQTELARALGVPGRTLARRKREGVLTSEESAKLLRLARVAGRANGVFENPKTALHWLKSPNAALAGATPLSLLDTDIGAESVLDTLGRIEHGVFA